MKLHFIYAFSPDSKQIQSPHARTKNLYKFLSERVEVVYHQWDSKIVPNLTPNDVVLGHPHYDSETIVQQIFRRNMPCKARCLIHPFHHRRVQDNMPFDFMARQADKIFSICGPYWYDTVQDTAFAHWKPKMIRLDSAVDPVHFPFLRTETGPLAFKPPGQRKLIYMGGGTPHKNLGYLTQIMQRMPDVQLCWYGGNADHPLTRLPNVRCVGWQMLNRQVAEQIVMNHDVMVSVSLSDANPTTLVETRAWGLVAACTKESGYYNDPFFTELFLDDIDKTIRAIRGLLTESSDVLYKRAVASRAEIESRYTWPNVCNIVWSNISQYFQ